MTKRQKRRLIRRIKNLVFTAFIGVLGGLIILQIFLGAVLQESYKLAPVTEAEKAMSVMTEMETVHTND